MPFHMQATLSDADATMHLAERLLGVGRSVIVVTDDPKPFTMLVNRYGERFQTIPIDGDHIATPADAIAYAETTFTDTDALLIVRQR